VTDSAWTAGELMNPDPRTVTVWSDIGCPWATLALHTLRERARERGVEILIDHRAFPLELFNRIPTPKHILDAEIVTIAGHRPELGWRFWAGPDSTYPVTTLPPMEAVQAAKDPSIGGLRGSDELDAALRKAFYVDGQCISMPSVILDVAAECEHVDPAKLATAIARGAGRPDVYDQWEIAKGPGVQGSPHLYAGNGFAAHNPGATYHWTNRPPIGFPRLDDYHPEWVDELLDGIG
jgi:predicted DsbA family dithiol-disulfide isomerase